ncbi:hypothetical protein [Collimonas humicola]|uniref:nSTAND3 domain-containing NTPase n=1 Tax=Collimonas humicola TaxID=2825886 RepID=UPI001B8D5C91|nr:hypothetical protein [Collimonas humicola]
MSIEIIGPKKYEFQDRVCSLIGLMYAENMQAQLHIEPNDGEDAQLSLSAGTRNITFEIQVKGAKTKIDMDTLADWMAHFPARESSESLFERVLQDPNRIALVIATGRCDDASSVFQAALDEAGTQHRAGIVQSKDAAALRKGFENYAIARSTDTLLAANRRKHIGAYISSLTASTLRQAAHRIQLVELIDDEKLQRERHRMLTEIHGLPPDVVPALLAKLDAIVVSEKRTGEDIIPQFRELISLHRPINPLRPANYLFRGDEEELQTMLSKEGFLLLSGLPRVGKTATARWIAANLQAQGYKVHVVESIDAAQRFLMDPVAEARLALVDDPFGGAHPTDAPAREFAVLERLLKTLPSNRRLIVAQAEDRLLEVTRKGKVEEIKLAGAPWVRLENKVGNFLADLWAQECRIQEVPSHQADYVRNALLLGELDLEPGCLVHLAVNHIHLPRCDLESIKRLARQDAASIAAAFRVEGLASLAAALAVGTTSTTAIAPTELAFALGRGAPDRPGEADVIGTMVSFGAESKFPAPLIDLEAAFVYDVQPKLADEHDEALERLEIRRMIEIPGGDGYLFTHPSYRAGAEILIDAATERSTKSALATVARCLFSLSSDTANAAAANLPWLYERLSTPAARDGVIAIAIDGMKSMWPDAREKCLQFLARRFSKFTYEQRETISQGSWNVSAFGRDEVEWANGRPFIPKPIGRVIETFVFRTSPSGIAVEKTLADLSDVSQVTVSAEAAADAAEFLSCNPERAAAQIIGRLLSFELATLIRAPAIEAWLCRPRENDEALLSRIFGEEQPAIVSAVFKATVGVWWDCTQARRDTLQTGLVKVAGSPVGAYTLFGHLVKFERREETGKRPPWHLFEALMPEVMNHLPILPTDQAAKLYAVMEEAIKHVGSAVVLTIVDAWLTFVQDIATRRPPNDYILGVVTILLDATAKCPGDRASRVEAVLGVPGTGARIRVMTDLVDRWSDLTAKERVCVIGQLAAPSSDTNWLRAAAITRPQVPIEVMQAVLPRGIDLDSTTEDLLRTLPIDLLKTIVRLYSMDHPAIEFSASQRFGKTVWEPVLEAIAADAKHPFFKQALQYLISSRSSRLSALIASLSKEHADLIFEILLKHVTHSGGDFLPEAWGALFELDLDDEIREEYFQRMADAAPMAAENFKEITSWVPEPHLQEFLEEFDYDVNLIKLADLLFAKNRDDMATANGEELRKKYIELVRDQPPKHWVTYELISKKIRRKGAHDDGLVEELERLGRQAHAASTEKPGMVFEPLENWIDPRS